jgi:hypothetical protein
VRESGLSKVNHPSPEHVSLNYRKLRMSGAGSSDALLPCTNGMRSQ